VTVPGMDTVRPDRTTRCPGCDTPVMGVRDGERFDYASRRRCDWGNCHLRVCHACGLALTRGGFGLAGYPDCPCDGRRVPPLRWPWTNERFVSAYCRYHMWAFGIRLNAGWWRFVFLPVPYLLFGNYTGAVYRDARLHDPHYFEQKVQ
jgi:hypothetical protein